MLVIAQKKMLSNKGKEVALIAFSSSAGKSKKKKGNKNEKPQIPGPSKKKLKKVRESVSTARRMRTEKRTAQSILLL